ARISIRRVSRADRAAERVRGGAAVLPGPVAGKVHAVETAPLLQRAARDTGRQQRAFPFALRRRDDETGARLQRVTELVIPRQPHVFVPITCVCALFIVRSAELETIIEQQPAERPRAVV